MWQSVMSWLDVTTGSNKAKYKEQELVIILLYTAGLETTTTASLKTNSVGTRLLKDITRHSCKSSPVVELLYVLSKAIHLNVPKMRAHQLKI